MAWVSSSFDEYVQKMDGDGLTVTMTAKPTEKWRANEIAGNGVSLRWGQEGGAVVVAGASRPNSVAIGRPLRDYRGTTLNGSRVDDDSFLVNPPRSEFCFARQRWGTWFCIDLSDPTLTIKRHAHFIRASPQARDAITDVVTRIISAVEKTPHLRDEPGFVAAAMASLEAVTRATLQAGSGTSKSAGGRGGPQRISRARLVRTVEAIIARHAGAHLKLEDLATEADVSPRTLYNAFRDYYGKSVQKMIHLRNVQEARRQLSAARPETSNVTTIALDLGFWDLSRFAREYREIYGEPPSATLRRLD